MLKWPVLGDDSVLVRLETGLDGEGTEEFGIFLVGHPRDTAHYRRAEIGFGEEHRHTVEITAGAATLALTHEALEAIANEKLDSLTLIGAGGQRREVDLESGIAEVV